MKNLLLLLVILQVNSTLFSQKQTVGLLTYKPDLIADGYTLFFPRNQPNVYLINNCGEIVHTWEDDDVFVPNNAVYILENGNLVKCKKTPSNGLIGNGGGGYFVEIRSWENDLIWAYELNTTTERLHHDVEVLPNGNILMIAWEQRSAEEAIENGRIPETLKTDVIYPDYIFEINPETNAKVWEWHVWDHLIQDADSTKANFGTVEEHPELIDINYLENQGPLDWDWLHINAIDYNAELDQVMLCVPYFNEIWIIDHSTSSEEAAGHVGGNSGKGGDLLYRVGNPLAYKSGTEEDKILFFPHDSHWTNDFIDVNHEHHEKILVFNNNVGSDFSKMEIFTSSWNQDSMTYLKEDGVYPPTEFINSITHPIPDAFFSRGLSSVQALPNGNILANSGTQGYFIELTPFNELVWEYKVPMRNGFPVNQGANLKTNDNLTFRAFKYPKDYIGFDGRDLSPKGYIELEPYEDYCERLVNVKELTTLNLKIAPNPASSYLDVTWQDNIHTDIRIFDLLGRERLQSKTYGNSVRLQLSDLEKGIYILDFNNEEKITFTIF